MYSSRRSISFCSEFTCQESCESEEKVLAHYEFGRLLGKGANSTVHEVKYIPTGERFALKKVQKDKLIPFWPEGSAALQHSSASFSSTGQGFCDQKETVLPQKESLEKWGGARGVSSKKKNSCTDLTEKSSLIPDCLNAENNESRERKYRCGRRQSSSGLSNEFSSVFNGSNSPVHKKRPKETEVERAMRVYLDDFERKIVNEAKLMQAIEHPHVVKFYKFLKSDVAYYFLMELAEQGELFDLIVSEEHFSENEARNYFHQLISAIDYCHSKGIVHKDLKAENLLLSSDSRLLVCDFGFSSRLESNFDAKKNASADFTCDIGALACFQGGGTRCYRSPEAIAAAEWEENHCWSSENGDGRQSRGVLSESSSLSESVGDSHAGNSTLPVERGVKTMVANIAINGSKESQDIIQKHEESLELELSSAGHLLPLPPQESPCKLKDAGSAEVLLGTSATNETNSVVEWTSEDHASVLRQRKDKRDAVKSKKIGFFTGGEQHRKRNQSDCRVGEEEEHEFLFVSSPTLQNAPSSPVSDKVSPPETMKANSARRIVLHSSEEGHHFYCTSNEKDENACARTLPHENEILTGSFPSSKLRFRGSHEENIEGEMTKRKEEEAPIGLGGLLSSSCQSSFVCSPAVNPFSQDLWSAGFILFFMLTGRLPFKGDDEYEIQENVVKGIVELTNEEAKQLSPEVQQLVMAMLEHDVDDRLSLDEIISHPWFRVNLDMRLRFPQRVFSSFSSTESSARSVGRLKTASDRMPYPTSLSSSRSSLIPSLISFCRDKRPDATAHHTNGFAESIAPNEFLQFTGRNPSDVLDEEEDYIRRAFSFMNTNPLKGDILSREEVDDALTILGGDSGCKTKDVSKMMYLLTGKEDQNHVTLEQFRDAWVRRDLGSNALSKATNFQLKSIVATLPHDHQELTPFLLAQLRSAFDMIDVDHKKEITEKDLENFFQCQHVEVEKEDLLSLMNVFRTQVSGHSFSESPILPSISMDSFGTSGSIMTSNRKVGGKIVARGTVEGGESSFPSTPVSTPAATVPFSAVRDDRRTSRRTGSASQQTLSCADERRGQDVKKIPWTVSGSSFTSSSSGNRASTSHIRALTTNRSPLPQMGTPSTLSPGAFPSSSVSFVVPNSSFRSSGSEHAAEDNPLHPASLPPSISFNVFLAGITEAFLRHPLGRKLVFATNLGPLLNEFSVRDSLRHGFVVHGTFFDVTFKLKKCSPQRLKYVNEVFSEENSSKILTFIYYVDSSCMVENGQQEMPFSSSFSPFESATEFHVENHEPAYPSTSGCKNSASLHHPLISVRHMFRSRPKEGTSSTLRLQPFRRLSSHPPGSTSVVPTATESKRRSTPCAIQCSPKRSYRRASLPDMMTTRGTTAAGVAKDNAKGMKAASPPRRQPQVREEKWRTLQQIKHVGTTAAIARVHTKIKKMRKVVVGSTKRRKKIVPLSESKVGDTACKSRRGRGTAPCSSVPLMGACSSSFSMKEKKGGSQLLFHRSTGHAPTNGKAGKCRLVSPKADPTQSCPSSNEKQQGNLSAQENSLQSDKENDTLPLAGPAFQLRTSPSSPCSADPSISSGGQGRTKQPYSILSPLKLRASIGRSKKIECEPLFHAYDSKREGVDEKEGSFLPYSTLQSSNGSFSNKIEDGTELAAVLNTENSSEYCVIKLKLTSMKSDYVLIEFQENSGSAACFSKAVTFVGRALETEREEAMQDTRSYGESELM